MSAAKQNIAIAKKIDLVIYAFRKSATSGKFASSDSGRPIVVLIIDLVRLSIVRA